VIAYQEMMGPLTVVTGPRGVGKTSLLLDVADNAAESGFVVAWLAGSKGRPFLGDLVDVVDSAIEDADVQVKVDTRRRASEIGVQLNAGLVKVSATSRHDTPSPGEQPSPSISFPKLLRYLGKSATAITDRGGAGLLIVVDELHAPLESSNGRLNGQITQAVTDASVLLNAVQYMEAQRTRFPLGVIGAGLPSTMRLLTEAATFAERTHELQLAMMDTTTSKLLLSEPARARGVTWHTDALEAVTRAGAGYPQSLQLMGAAIWDTVKPRANGQITLADVTQSQPIIHAQLNSMYATRWSITTNAEKRLLFAMAQHPEDPVPRLSIAERLGISSEILGPTRQALLSKGVIESPKHGYLRFTVPGFAAFVLDQNVPTNGP